MRGREVAPEEGVDNVIARVLEGRPRPPYIGWCAMGYKLVYIYSNQLQHGKLNRDALSCLVLQLVFMSLGPHVRSGKVHGQVGGSSGRSGPPVEDS
jgi:hypothetical protein